MLFGRLTAFSHTVLHQVLRPGDIALDATCGNGHDTLFLAREVGAGGLVHAFDIQEQALQATGAALAEEGMRERVVLHHASHEAMGELLGAELKGRVRAVMFNLGYLPWTDKALTTRAETTIPAIDAALSLLAPVGIMTIAVYTGHEGGEEESKAVHEHLAALPAKIAQVVQVGMLNHPDPALRLILVEKPR